MSISATIAFVVQVLKAINALLVWLHDRGLVAEGQRQATAEAVQKLNSTVAKAASAVQEANEKAEKDSTDAAFDRDFWRDKE